MTNRRELGKLGEAVSVKYLTEHNYMILEQNFTYRHAEIDIIAQVDDTIIFIEVKTRMSSDYNTGEQSINERKKRLLKRCAEGYIEQNGIRECECRFDAIIVVDPYRESEELTHYKSIIEY